MRALLSLVIASTASLGAASQAAAGGKQEQAALAELEAAYQATGKLAAGRERTRTACADAPKLKSAASAIPEHHAPATAAVDDSTWMLTASALGSRADDLIAVCKTPDHKLKDVTGEVETADEIVAIIGDLVHSLLDAAKVRDLSPAMKQFRTTLKGMTSTSRQLCSQQAKLVKLLPEMATPPAKADPNKWKDAHSLVKPSLDELKRFGCDKPRGTEEEITGSLNLVHDRYYVLVLMVPPHT